jgi:hypothetical protein
MREAGGNYVASRTLIGQAERVIDSEPSSWCPDVREEARLDDATIDDVAGTDATGCMDSFDPVLAFGGGADVSVVLLGIAFLVAGREVPFRAWRGPLRNVMVVGHVSAVRS